MSGRGTCPYAEHEVCLYVAGVLLLRENPDPCPFGAHTRVEIMKAYVKAGSGERKIIMLNWPQYFGDAEPATPLRAPVCRPVTAKPVFTGAAWTGPTEPVWTTGPGEASGHTDERVTRLNEVCCDTVLEVQRLKAQVELLNAQVERLMSKSGKGWA